MLTLYYVNEEAVNQGERYGLYLIKLNPRIAKWLPLAYKLSKEEFNNPNGVVFEYNKFLNVVTKHTKFSQFIEDLIYYTNIRNMPVRSIQNGVGSTDIAGILFSLYALIIYLRLT